MKPSCIPGRFFIFEDFSFNFLFMSHFSIGEMAGADRPREKLFQSGCHTLTDSELLAILLRNGTRGESALQLARRILAESENDLTRLSRLDVAALSSFKGMGRVKALTVIAALELGRRRRLAEASKMVKVSSSTDVAGIFLPLLSDLQHEEFWILLLNRAHAVISRVQISKGGIAGTVVDPKMIFRKAIEVSASGIILCHNHPSGNRTPSDADIALTRKVSEAGRLFDISVLDHIIIAAETYYSFSDEGKM